jgi:uncharacterized membrane protein YpjA
MVIITSHGIGLMAELTAALLLIVALTGFLIKRNEPWLVCLAAAMLMLIVAVTIVVEGTT